MSLKKIFRPQARVARPGRAACPALPEVGRGPAGRVGQAAHRVPADFPAQARPAALLDPVVRAVQEALPDGPAECLVLAGQAARVVLLAGPAVCLAAVGHKVARLDRVDCLVLAGQAARVVLLAGPAVCLAAGGRKVAGLDRVDCPALVVPAAQVVRLDDREGFPARVALVARLDRVGCPAPVGQVVQVAPRVVPADCLVLAAQVVRLGDREGFPARVALAARLDQAAFPVAAASLAARLGPVVCPVALAVNPAHRLDRAGFRAAALAALLDALAGCLARLLDRRRGPAAALRAVAHVRALCQAQSAVLRLGAAPLARAGWALRPFPVGLEPPGLAQRHLAPGPAPARPRAVAPLPERGPRPLRRSRCCHLIPSSISWVWCVSLSP